MAGALDSGSGRRRGLLRGEICREHTERTKVLPAQDAWRKNVDTDEGERRDRDVAQGDRDLACAGDSNRGAIYAAHGASSGSVYNKALRLGECGVEDRVIGACVGEGWSLAVYRLSPGAGAN